jgi:hypothetical protein
MYKVNVKSVRQREQHKSRSDSPHRQIARRTIFLTKKNRIARGQSAGNYGSVVFSLPFESILSKIFKYEAHLSASMMSFILISSVHIRWTELWKLWSLIDRTSSIYLNVWLKDKASFFFSFLFFLSRNSFLTHSVGQ